MATFPADTYSSPAARSAPEPRVARKASQRRTAALAAASACLAAPVALVALAAWAVIHVGGWLVVEDRLEPARAVVVLGGQVPFRAMEAARIYQRGLAPEVWLTRGPSSAESVFDRLRVAYVR